MANFDISLNLQVLGKSWKSNVVVDGIPLLVPIEEKIFKAFRQKKPGRLNLLHKEKKVIVDILVLLKKDNWSPYVITIKNEDQRSKDYSDISKCLD